MSFCNSPFFTRIPETPPASRPGSFVRGSGLADALGVSAGTGVDLHDVALVDEERDLNFVAVVDLRRLGHVRRRISANARLGVDDLLFDEGRQRDLNRLPVEKQEVAEALLDQEIDLVAERFGRNGHLFIGVRVAENVVVPVEVGVVHFALFEVRLVDLVGRPVGFFHAGAVDEIAHAAAVERGPLAGLAEIKLGDDPRHAVDFDLEAFLQVGSTEHLCFTP